MKLRIDAHQHFWNLDKVSYPWLTSKLAPIDRTFEAPELEPLLRAAGISKTVIVQALDAYVDTDYMLDTAAGHDWVGGVVGWVPLDRPDEAAAKLEQYTKNPVFKGVRHLIHDLADPDWVMHDSVIEGLKVLASFGMTFDYVAVFPNHLKHLPLLAEKVPDLKIVIDHLAKPPIGKEQSQWTKWQGELAAAASYPQIYAKISGLNTATSNPGSWTADDIRPAIDEAVSLFGADRVMWGSDWPVALLAGTYAQVWEETNRAIASYSEAERDAMLGGTAISFYRMQV
ncbi:amidohydrolase family protein [Paenibacillus koleovorans]|uniref:amidohydrolase family protein n=1 Tax=Paenibacillus koleovorans TaxID=121608 RepID=UPI001FEC84AD|nr:amidohydrolase family protein [Paenibacillus koleovorans]